MTLNDPTRSAIEDLVHLERVEPTHAFQDVNGFREVHRRDLGFGCTENILDLRRRGLVERQATSADESRFVLPQ
jgi:hypothetical protein